MGQDATQRDARALLEHDGERRLMAFWEGGAESFRLPASGSLVIGRSEECDVVIDHASVSRRHVIWHVGSPDVIEDCGSSNGTRVSGARLEPHARVTLGPSAVVEIGRVMLVAQQQRGERVEPRSSGRAALGAPAITSLPKLIELAAPTPMTVLITGETGVGKDVLAEELHRRSGRTGPFVRVNCAALTESLFESELFGHDRGAFTGAVANKTGLLESAAGGTVLLDEVGELTLAMQAKLLLVLERREVFRVGSVRPVPIDVRFLAATNRDLPRAVAEKGFRQDLYFRLAGVTLRIPPLRERTHEIEALARVLVAQACEQSKKPTMEIAAEALAALHSHEWPGNIRELRAVLERAVAFATSAVVDKELLRLAMSAGAEISSAPVEPARSSRLRPALDAVERERIVAALERCQGNQKRTAEELGISLRTLVSRLSAYGLTRPRR